MTEASSHAQFRFRDGGNTRRALRRRVLTVSEARRDSELAMLLGADAATEADFRRLYELTAGAFTAVLRGMLDDTELAADVLQATYITVWRNAARFDPRKGSAIGWMFTILRNKAIDELRARARRPDLAASGEAILRDLPCREPQADACLAHVDARERLGQLLAKLPPERAYALREVVGNGRSAVDVALDLGRSDNTVKSWIRRGLVRLRRDFGEESFSDWI